MATIVVDTRPGWLRAQFVWAWSGSKWYRQQGKKQQMLKKNYSLVHHLVYCGFYSFIYRFAPKVVLFLPKATFLTSLWPWPLSESEARLETVPCSRSSPLLVGLMLGLQDLAWFYKCCSINWFDDSHRKERERRIFFGRFTWIIPSLGLSSPFLWLGSICLCSSFTTIPKWCGLLWQQIGLIGVDASFAWLWRFLAQLPWKANSLSLPAWPSLDFVLPLVFYNPNLVASTDFQKLGCLWKYHLISAFRIYENSLHPDAVTLYCPI